MGAVCRAIAQIRRRLGVGVIIVEVPAVDVVDVAVAVVIDTWGPVGFRHVPPHVRRQVGVLVVNACVDNPDNDATVPHGEPRIALPPARRLECVPRERGPRQLVQGLLLHPVRVVWSEALSAALGDPVDDVEGDGLDLSGPSQRQGDLALAPGRDDEHLGLSIHDGPELRRAHAVAHSLPRRLINPLRPEDHDLARHGLDGTSRPRVGQGYRAPLPRGRIWRSLGEGRHRQQHRHQHEECAERWSDSHLDKAPLLLTCRGSREPQTRNRLERTIHLRPLTLRVHVLETSTL